MIAAEPQDPGLDVRLPMLLSSWKPSGGFRAVGVHHFRKRLIPHGSQTELNHELQSRSQTTAGWFFIAWLVLAAMDHLCLRIGPSGGL